MPASPVTTAAPVAVAPSRMRFGAAVSELLQRWTLPVLHLIAVLYLAGPSRRLIAFFVLSFLVALGKRYAGERQGLYKVVAFVAFTGLLFVARDSYKIFGVSYCYLRAMYAVVDKRQWTFLGYLEYFFFLPTYVSGPVASPSRLEQLRIPFARRPWRLVLARGLWGAMKLSVAALVVTLTPLKSAEQIALSLGTWSVAELWAGVFLSGVVLYLNFSAFTDLYVSASLVFGVVVPENFAGVWKAGSLTEFWRRWHVSLGSWMRAVLYNPLSRAAQRLGGGTLLAAIVVPLLAMTFCGAWHGLTWSFLAWGALHGVGLSVHAAWVALVRHRLPAAWTAHASYGAGAWLLTHGYVTLSWVSFFPPPTTFPSRRVCGS